MAMRTCGHAAMWPCGHVAMRPCGHVPRAGRCVWGAGYMRLQAMWYLFLFDTAFDSAALHACMLCRVTPTRHGPLCLSAGITQHMYVCRLASCMPACVTATVRACPPHIYLFLKHASCSAPPPSAALQVLFNMHASILACTPSTSPTTAMAITEHAYGKCMHHM